MIYIILLLFIFVIVLRFRHTRIVWSSLFKKGFKKKDDKFGITCVSAKQGQGKTLYCIEFLLNNSKGYKVYANLKNIKGLDYTYFTGLEELLKISNSIKNNSKVIIFYDELFTAVIKDTKNSKEVMKFLSQMRKKGVIFLTTAQEWLEIPITWRRYCRFNIECKMINLFGRAYCIRQVYNAYEIKWNKDENEYIAPLIETIITKGSYKIANSYDTYEQI